MIADLYTLSLWCTVPPPPPIGGGFPGVPMKKPVVPNVPLPMLNWLPIRNPEHTIFKVYGSRVYLKQVVMYVMSAYRMVYCSISHIRM